METLRHETSPALARATGTLIAIGCLLEVCYASLYAVAPGPPKVIGFIAINLVAYALLAFALWGHRSVLMQDDRRVTALIIAFGILFRVTLVPHAPVASDDIYRYLWDGQLTVHGVNPYAYAPGDPALSAFTTTDLPARVNHPDIGTIYPPLAQGLFALSALVCGESITGLKAILTAADIAGIMLLAALLRALRRSPAWVMIYAWSPLPVLYGSLDGHVDILGIPLLVLILLGAVRTRYVQTVVGVAGAALVKLHPLVVAPLLWRLRRGKAGMVLAALPVVLFALAYLPFVGHLSEALHWASVYGSRWEYNAGVFSVVYSLVGSNERAHMVMNVLLGLWIAWLVARNASFTDNVFMAFLGLVILGPVVHPWYLLWLAALIVVRWSLAVFVFLGLSAVSNIVVWRYIATGQWNDDPVLLLIQYVPLLALLVREIVRKPYKEPEPIV